jgi:chromosome segregation ATPase
MIRRRATRHAYCLVTLALAATIAPGRVRAQQGAAAPIPQEDEIRRLQAHSAELLQQIETLRAALTRSEKARLKAQTLLESVSRRLREQLEAKQASDAEGVSRREKEVASIHQELAEQGRALTETRNLLAALEAEGEKQASRASALESEIAKLREGAATQEAERPRLSAELQKFQEDSEQRKAKIDTLQREVDTLRGAAGDREMEIKRHAEELRAKDEKSGRQIAVLTIRAEALESDLSRDRAERDRQAAEVRRLEEEKRALSNKVAGPPHAGDAATGPATAALQQHPGELQTIPDRLEASRRESQNRIATLDAELRLVRDREHASRTEVKDLQQALAAEKLTSRSKLEALQSVLQNTRSAGAELHAELDDARRQNTDLSRQVAALNEAVRKVHDLRTKYQEKALQLQEPAPVRSGNREIHEQHSQQSSTATALGGARSEPLPGTVPLNQTMSVGPAPGPAVAQTPLAAETDPAAADLREQLSLERERRETLEQEIQRLTASGLTEEKFVEVWKALQSARSEILVLSNQLTDERKSRENLEVTLARVQRESGGEAQSPNDFVRRLAETLNERRAEADRLGAQLKDANEIIVRLKGRLEATGSPAEENKILSDLDKENTDLRDALKAAQEANTSLRAKAEMAERLAEMVYGKAP